jgi:hypothetical protein
MCILCVLAMRACPARATAEYLDTNIANSWELMKQKRNALRPQIAGGIVQPISEARQFGLVVSGAAFRCQSARAWVRAPKLSLIARGTTHDLSQELDRAGQQQQQQQQQQQ